MSVLDLISITICLTMVILVIIACLVDLKADRYTALANWLKWAVVQAERELGGKTGQLKLQMVYDMAVSRFAWLATAITFDEFSKMVDNALSWMREQVDKNVTIKKNCGG